MKPMKSLNNKQSGTVAAELKEALQKGSRLSVVSAYFTIYAFAEMKKELSKVASARFLFTDPSFAGEHKEVSRAFLIESTPSPQTVAGNEFEIRLRNEMKQAAIARECAQWLRTKAEIKSLKKPNSAQMRMICVDNHDDSSVAINGTVDFTTDGLGLTPSNRFDCNTCMYGTEFTASYLKMFGELWEDGTAVEDVKAKVLAQMQTLYTENPPEFIYFVTLYHVFYAYLGELTEDRMIKSKTGIQDTLIWKKLYKFQRDGAMGAIDKIERYNGCIIADSVGLGKTFTALAVIKYYELRNDRVLVLAPKKLHENWSIYTQNDVRNIFEEDRFQYTVLNHTDLSRTSGFSGDMNLATIKWSNYDLVVIDESHNFRNNPPVKGRVTRYERLMNDIIKSGVKTKVLMLSATPVNNRMNDIKNQIAFITEDKPDALADIGLANIEQVLRKAQTVFNRWSLLPDGERTTDSFVEMMSLDYFKLLDTLTIARSRKHIEKYYDAAEIGRFPTRLPPRNEYSGIDTEGEFPPIEEVNNLIRKLTLGIYSPLRYVLPEKRAEYDRKYDVEVDGGHSIFRQADRETHIIGLMRVGMLKRMESSIRSFSLTVEKILGKTTDTLALIEEKQFDYDEDLNIGDIDLDDAELDDLMFGKNVKVLLQDMDLIRWQQDLELDREKLSQVLEAAKEITAQRDLKLRTLKEMIREKMEHPINGNNRKIVVFTAFADTANYLYDNLAPALKSEGVYAAIVTGSGENRSTLPLSAELRRSVKISDLNSVLTLFSPRSKDCAKVFPTAKDEIDVLIATDCISEGQNLQDCDFLINYDIHWNPVRIIQRFGRIDRIGSVNDVIQLVNFWPMRDLDAYINLAQRVKGRMVLLDVSATGEDNLIDDEQGREMKDLEYRKKQLTQLQEKVVDLEDISGGISITDLTFNDFKVDLMEYMKTNRKKLEDAPTGLYAVAQIDPALQDTVSPGVIFVLRQLKGAEQTREQNGLFPYYLVYITDGGEVKLTFVHGKKILDILKKLCYGQKDVLRDLVAQFDAETAEGTDMKHYSALLEAAIENLVGKKQEIGVASLFSKGGTTLQAEYYDGIEDFELTAFLVLK
ncbi:MAG: helicase-related protein [Oscillospiraceae bacterium]